MKICRTIYKRQEQLFMQQNNIWRSKQHSFGMKIKLLSSKVKSAWLCGSKSWKKAKKNLGKKTVFFYTDATNEFCKFADQYCDIMKAGPSKK